MSVAAAVAAFVCMLAGAAQRENSGGRGEAGVDPSAVARLGIYHTRARACRPILAATIGDNRADKRAR